MNHNKLYTMTEAVLDETLKLREQSAFNRVSDNGRREMIREVLTIWEERQLRNRFYEIVSDEELSEFFSEFVDCNTDSFEFSPSDQDDLASLMNRKFEIRKDA